MLICGLGRFANNAQSTESNKEGLEPYLKHSFESIMFMLNGYRKFTGENTHSYGLSCAGIDILGPKIEIENGRISISIKLDKNPVHKLQDP